MKNLSKLEFDRILYFVAIFIVIFGTILGPSASLDKIYLPLVFCTLFLMLIIPVLILLLATLLFSVLQTPTIVKLSKTMVSKDRPLIHEVLDRITNPAISLALSSLPLISLLILSSMSFIVVKVTIIYCGLFIVYIYNEFEYLVKASKGLLLEESWWKLKEFDFISSLEDDSDSSDNKETSNSSKP